MAEAGADQLMGYTREFARQAADAVGDVRAYAAGLVAEAEIYAPLGDLLMTHDVLVCPTIAAFGFEAGQDYADRGVAIAGHELPWTDVLMTLPFNVIGRAPVLSVPSGRSSTGLPTGVQIVGRTYDDGTVFRAGAALESALGLWSDPTWRPGL